MIIFILFLLFVLTLFYFRIYFLNKKLSLYKNILFNLSDFFIKQSKLKISNREDELTHCKELYYQTSMVNILFSKINKLENLNFFILIFKNYKKIDNFFKSDLFKIIYAYQNNYYLIDYYIYDLEILKTKDCESKEFRIKILYTLVQLEYNYYSMKKIKELL